jgi:ribonuclease HIII
MSQATRVLEVRDPQQAAAIERRLRDGLPPEAEWRPAPHASFSVKALGVVATCYRSGKLVLQGRELDTFVARFLPELAPAGKGERRNDPELPFDATVIASDEAGKGDYFGPLVVAAVVAAPADTESLRELGVADSKTIADERARRIAGALTRALDHEIVSLLPERYNAEHRARGNLNLMLADLHADAIAALRQRHPDVELVVVDRFADERVLAKALAAREVRVDRLVQAPRAERHPAVAAASILARVAFLEGLAACSDECGTDLHLGAGPPTDVAARRVYAIGGRDLLAKVAKLHFKNTARAERPS